MLRPEQVEAARRGPQEHGGCRRGGRRSAGRAGAAPHPTRVVRREQTGRASRRRRGRREGAGTDLLAGLPRAWKAVEAYAMR